MGIASSSGSSVRFVMPRDLRDHLELLLNEKKKYVSLLLSTLPLIALSFLYTDVWPPYLMFFLQLLRNTSFCSMFFFVKVTGFAHVSHKLLQDYCSKITMSLYKLLDRISRGHCCFR